MPKKKDPPGDPKAQHERFKETAREIGATDAKAFEQAFGKIVPPKRGDNGKPEGS